MRRPGDKSRMALRDKVLRCRGEPSDFPYPTQNVADFMEEIVQGNINQYGNTTWMTNITTGRSMTYAELLKSVRKISSALKRRGFQQGDSVSIMAANFIEIVIVFFSVWKLGGSTSCLTLNLFPKDIKGRLQQTKPKYIFTDEPRASRVKQALNNLCCVEEVFTLDNNECEDFLPYDSLLNDDGKGCPDGRTVDPNSMAWLMFSSGTTGVPKGIVHTFRSISAIGRSYTYLKMAGKRELFINLMVNSGGMGTAIAGTVCHAELYCLSEYSDTRLLEAIHKVKPHVVSMFPSQIAWICKHPSLESFDTACVQEIYTGGSSINPVYERMIFDKFVNLSMLRVFYGLSETGLVTSNASSYFEFERYDRASATAKHIIGSCGKVVPYCALKVVDPEKNELLGPNEAGELAVKTPFMMKEYLGQPKETEYALRDGWFFTGDKGYYDEAGNVFVIGRYKELIKYRMAHVVPTNIEKHIMTHPSVEDAGVIGLPHDVDGELPMAFVVLREGKPVTPEEIINYTNERVIDEEKLRGGVRVIDKIPRNDFGKIMRGQLAKLLQNE